MIWVWPPPPDSHPSMGYFSVSCTRLSLDSITLNVQSSMVGIFPFPLPQHPTLLFVPLNPTSGLGFGVGSHLLQEASSLAGSRSTPPCLHSVSPTRRHSHSGARGLSYQLTAMVLAPATVLAELFNQADNCNYKICLFVFL